MESRAEARWEGDLMTGKGSVSSRTSGVLREAGLTWKARTEAAGGTTTTPEELLAAAHASCFAMALSHGLSQQGKKPQRLEVAVKVTFGPKSGGFSVQESAIEVKGTVPGLDAAAFQKAAEAAKDGCPISQALKNNVKMSVQAKLA
jgi:osmotically inducible protein OsmC